MSSSVVLDSNPHTDAKLSELERRWKILLRDQPKCRIRDAAHKLGVSELELVTLDNANTTRLRPEWPSIISALESAGPLMALSRNESAVHEKTGIYAGLRGNEVMGLMIQEDIDLRLIFQRWKFAYSVKSENGRDSIQFFAGDGSAIHKVYCTEFTDQYAWQEIIETFQSDELAPVVEKIKSIKNNAVILDETEQDRFLQKWSEITDVHQFFGLLREFSITRIQSMELAENAWTYAVDVQLIPSFIEEVAGTGLSIMVFVANDGIVQIHTGPIERCMTAGEWFNILDPKFSLHLNTANLTKAWAVRKPTNDGIVSSLEVYDKDGSLVMQLFGARQEGTAEQSAWRSRLLAFSPDMPAIEA